jgi:hypothetical protein
MESNFLTALIPDPAWCLGVRLRPFSLGHLVLLRRVNSPFVSREGQVVLGDLILAVILCADDFADGAEWLARMDHQSDADRETLADWGKKAATLDLDEEATAFIAYIRAADKMPEVFHSSTSGQVQEIGAPFWQIVYLTLHKQTNLRDVEIWNQPLGKTYCDYIALREQEQVLRIKSEQDEEIERLAREYYAKRAAEEAACTN